MVVQQVSESTAWIAPPLALLRGAHQELKGFLGERNPFVEHTDDE
jgi:hypothetical protein